MKKILILSSVLLFLSIICFGELQFDHQFSIPRMVDDSFLKDIWLADYDENGIDEIFVSYYDYYNQDNWCLVEYDQDGDSTSVFWQPSSESQQFSKCFTFKSDNIVYLVVIYNLLVDETLYCLMEVYDYEADILIDTEELEIGWSYEWYGYFFSTNYINMLSFDNSDFIYLGLQIVYGDDESGSETSKMYKYSFDQGLISLIEEVDRCGYKLLQPEGIDFLIAFGESSSSAFPDYFFWSYTIKTISQDYPAIVEDIAFFSDIESFTLTYLTGNDNNYQDYGLITWETQNYNFTCYSPEMSDTTWQVFDTELTDSQIKASTCVNTNQGDHFILYFYEDTARQNKFDVRDRISGNLALRGETDIMPYKILKKSDHDLLFLVKTDSLIDIYTLSEEIQVIIDEDEIAGNRSNLSNYPNPFNPETTISFDLAEAGEAEIAIYNIKGQKIRSLIRDNLQAGKQTMIWDGCDDSGKTVSSGVYYYRLQTGVKTSAVRKCLLLK